MSICLSLYLSIYVSVYLSRCLSIYLSASLKTAWLLQSLTWATSKTQQFCETSSIFQVGGVDSIKNEAILWDFLQKWKVECRADGLVPIRFAIFSVHVSKVLRLPRKSDARPYEALHLSRKIILANKKIWCSKMQPFSGNQRLGLQTCLAHVPLVPHLPREMHLCRSSTNDVPRLPRFAQCRIPCSCHTKQRCNVVFSIFTSKRALRAITACTFWTSQLPKVFRHWGVLRILTSKCASHHNDVHFLNISFPIKALQSWGAFTLVTSKCASRHNGVHFFFEKCSGHVVLCVLHIHLHIKYIYICVCVHIHVYVHNNRSNTTEYVCKYGF